MSTATNSPSSATFRAKAPIDSVWRNFHRPAVAQTSGSGPVTIDDGKDDSVSSKEAPHADEGSQGHTSPASSLTEDAGPVAGAWTEVKELKPAPLPINPWKAREAERKAKAAENSKAPPTKSEADFPTPNPASQTIPSTKSTTSKSKSNGVGGGKWTASSQEPANSSSSNPEEWPAPDAALSSAKEERVRPSTSNNIVSRSLDLQDESVQIGNDSKKKKWAKVEVDLQFDPPPQKGRSTRNKFAQRGGRSGGRDNVDRTEQNDNNERTSRVSTRQNRADGDEQYQGTKGANSAGKITPKTLRRAQSLNASSISPGKHNDLPQMESLSDWSLVSDSQPASLRTHQASQPLEGNWKQGSQSPVRPLDVQAGLEGGQAQTIRSPSPKFINQIPSSSPDSANQQSPAPSMHGRRHSSEASVVSGWNDDNLTKSAITPQWNQSQQTPTQLQLPQQSQSQRRAQRGSFRSSRIAGGFTNVPFNANQYPPFQPNNLPQQHPLYFSGYQPPFQPAFPQYNGRTNSLPGYGPSGNPRYQLPMQPWVPYGPLDYSGLGVQPLTVVDTQVPEFNDVRSRLLKQIEYYFSVDNLLKDQYLRKQMDSQGFVLVQKIAEFAKVKSLSTDIDLIMKSCLGSNTVETLFESERGPLIRSRDGPERWVIPDMEDRDLQARHPGPDEKYFKQQQAREQEYFQQHAMQYRGFENQLGYYYDPYGFGNGAYPAPGCDPYPSPTAQGGEASEMQRMPSPAVVSSSGSKPSTPQNRKLSGDAHIFVPGSPASKPLANGDSQKRSETVEGRQIKTVTEEGEDDKGDHTDEFDVANLEGLIVKVRRASQATERLGSDAEVVINGQKSDAQALAATPEVPVTWKIPDVTTATQASTRTGISIKSTTPFPNKDENTDRVIPESTEMLTETNLKQKEAELGVLEFSYLELREKALKARHSSMSDAKEANLVGMDDLYQFWNEFLVAYWVSSMYDEFVELAVKDANLRRRQGLVKLFSMQERALSKHFRARVLEDFIRLATEDYRNGEIEGVLGVSRYVRIAAERGETVEIFDNDVRRIIELISNSEMDEERVRVEFKGEGGGVKYTQRIEALSAQ